MVGVSGSIDGTTGNDTIIGTSGSDTINALSGEDTIFGTSGTDTIDGGPGNDVLAYDFSRLDSGLSPTEGARTITIGANTVTDSAGQFGADFTGVEQVAFTTSTVTFSGFATGTTIFDASAFTGSRGVVLVNALGNAPITFTGSAQDDTVVIRHFANVLDGGAGTGDRLNYFFLTSITLTETAGVITLASGGVNATATNFEQVEVGVLGGTGVINASTLTRDLTFRASYGQTIAGGAGADTFSNAFSGGSNIGPSQFSGGAGADRYYYTGFGLNFDGDTITDFSAEDRIDLSGVGLSTPATPAVFIGSAAFSGAVNQVRFVKTGTTTLIQVDENGDGLADATLTLANGAYDIVETAPGSAILRAEGITASVIAGGTGNDTLFGTADADLMTGAAGNDSLSGLGGNDTLNGGTGNDTLRGGEGNDTFVSDQAVQAEIFDGGAGTDTVELRLNPLQIVGSLGTVSIHTLNAAQFVSVERLAFASQAGEILQGQLTVPQVVTSGLTEIVGGAGTDLLTLIFTPGSSNPALTFTNFDPAPANGWGAISDRVTMVLTTPGTLNAYAGVDVLQVLAGGTGNDTINGSANADVLNGAAGVNVLNGGDGNDHLVLINQATPNGSGGFNPPSFLTGEGSLFNGGGGFDLVGIGGFVNFRGTLQDIEGFNLLPAFTPPVANTALQEPAYLVVNAATLAGIATPYFRGTGTVEINPSDPVTFEARSFDGSNIVIEEGADIHLVIGSGDNNGDNITITGSAYADEIFMGIGAQAGNGGDGDDVINIGNGDQTISGGAGADRFQIDDIGNGESGFSSAVITDFTLGEDKIDLDETMIINVRRAFDFVTQGPDGAVIGASNGGYGFSVTLEGVDLADLTAADFLLDQSEDTQFAQFETDSGLADIMLGGAQNDSLIGGEGNDTIYTGGGRDTIDGGNGDDRIIADGAIPGFAGGPSPVQFNGGVGFDVLELRSFEGSVESPFGTQLSTYAFLFNVSGIEEIEFASLAGEWVSTNLIARSVVTPPGGATQVANLPLPAHARGGEGMDSLALVAAGGMGGAAEILVPTFAFHDWDAVTKAYLPTDTLIYVGADAASPFNYVIRANNANAAQDVLQHLIGGGGNDTLIGSDGSDLLNGNGGTNLLQGLGGDDALIIANSAPSGGAPTSNTGAGSVFDGGEGNDFLSVGGVVNFQGTLQGIEGIYLQPEYALDNGAFGSQARAQLTISFAEFSKLGPNARFDGVGDIFVTMGLNDNLDTSGFVFEAGSDVTIDLGGDTFTGGTGNDSLTGTGGNDTFFLFGGRDTVVAGGGNDTVVLNGPVLGGSNLNGGPGTDTLVVESINLSIGTGSQFPGGIVTASNGLTGATVAGFERLAFASEANTASNFVMLLPQITSAFPAGAELVGGDGYDTLLVISLFNTANSPSGYVLNAPVFTYDNWQEVDRAYQPGDRVLVINNGNANGVMNGSAHLGVQVLVGGAGNETINGSDGMDFLAGGAGVNQLFGGGGDDTLFFGNTIVTTNNNGVVTTAPETTFDATGSHFDGGTGIDFLGIGGTVNFKGTLANFEGIYLSPAYDAPTPPTVQGQITTAQSQAYTVLTIDNSLFQLFPRDLEIDGVGTIHVEIDAGTRFDGSRIDFTDGSDVRFLLEGSDGNDIIIGTANDDTFEGGSGIDFFTGGAGNDAFRPTLGGKIVTDFTQGEDRIDLSETGIASLEQALGFFTQSSADALFAFRYAGLNNTLRLKNVNIADLVASDFIFASPTDSMTPDATELADVLIGQTVNDTLIGLGGNDTIFSGGGLDQIDAGEGNDTVVLNGPVAPGSTIQGGNGTDTLVVNQSAGFTVPGIGLVVPLTGANLGGFEALRFDATAGTTLLALLTPGQAASITTVTGSAGSDRLIISTASSGGTFALHTIGQINWTAGSDLIVFGNAQATGALNLSTANHVGVYVLQGGSGDDTITGSTGTEALLGNGGNDALTGGGGNDTLDGGAGNDTIDGGVGADSMIGGLGDDLFTLDNAGDTVLESAGGGTDTVTSATLTSINASSFGEIEVIRYTGTGNAVLTGTEGNNTLTGSSGADTLYGGLGDDRHDGGTGVDIMVGGQGNDTYVIDNVGDRGAELDGEGTDTFVTSLSSFSLFEYRAVENLTGTFAGGAVLTGNTGANAIVGAGGNDTLDGLAGADTLDGGLGDDVYVVDDALDGIVDSGGIDTVRARLSWTLADGLERLELLTAGTATGNGADNTITGSGGVDSLYGGGGNDQLTGGAGTDLLDGGSGADTMLGGLGPDTYIVDNAGDVVDETGGDGTDTVLASITSYSLTAGVERLTYTGSDSFSGTGNGQANLIIGGAGNDTLDGGAGNDTLDGGLGDDIYIVDSSTDYLRDSGGIDRVYSLASTYTLLGTLEHLYFSNTGDFTGTGNGLANEIGGGSGNDLLNGVGGADTLSGNEGNDTLLGGGGNDSLLGGQGDDLLVGGIGRDVMNGGAGADVFRFDTLTDTRTGANADVIANFVVGEDRIDVSLIDPNATLAGDQAYAFIGTAAYSKVAGQAEIRFFQSGGNTFVAFDNDGNGTADMAIQLNGLHTLTAAEFIL